MGAAWVFILAGAAIGAVVALVLLAPLLLPRLAGGQGKVLTSDRLCATVAVYDDLDEGERKRLEFQATRFLKRKRLRARQGDVPPIVQVAVAGNACLMRLHPSADCYPGIKTIELGDEATEIGADRVRLNVDAVQDAFGAGARNPVVRAFAPLLRDHAEGERNRCAAQYPEKWWRQFNDLRREIDAERSTVFAAYGDDAVADPFCTACEAYFQRGPQLADAHPKLHELLREFFAVDTARSR